MAIGAKTGTVRYQLVTAVEAAVGAVNGTVRRGMAQQLAVVSEALVGVNAAQKMVGEL